MAALPLHNEGGSQMNGVESPQSVLLRQVTGLTHDRFRHLHRGKARPQIFEGGDYRAMRRVRQPLRSPGAGESRPPFGVCDTGTRENLGRVG